jgi:hypothetical protein
MLCQKCQKNEAIISPTYGVLPCKVCQDAQLTLKGRKLARFTSINKFHRVQQQQDKHISDLEQPYIGDKINPTFAKLYPEQAEELAQSGELEKL